MRCGMTVTQMMQEEPTLDLYPHLEMKPKMDNAWAAKNLSWVG